MCTLILQLQSRWSKISDLNFNKILDELKDIHTKAPTLRFGEVVQNSIDGSKRLHNIHLGDRSSKEILKALIEYKGRL